MRCTNCVAVGARARGALPGFARGSGRAAPTPPANSDVAPRPGSNGPVALGRSPAPAAKLISPSL
eukprot:666122-Lingulodinium_polyedra.AAC.1